MFWGPRQNHCPTLHQGAGSGTLVTERGGAGPHFLPPRLTPHSGAQPSAPFVFHRLFADQGFFSTVLARKSGRLVFDGVLAVQFHGCLPHVERNEIL